MAGIFEITGDDVEQLDDSSLRELVGLLCEADFRKAGLPVNGIFWGGNQDAADGCFDVIVEGETRPPTGSFVKSVVTGFQVKKPKMAASAIEKEMLQDGVLKNGIREFVCRGGAYVIISSGDSITRGRGYLNRINAMKSAISTVAGLEDAVVDFYDRGSLATWVRQHPSMIIWVQSKLQKSLQGWQAYGDWAHGVGGDDGQYLLGEDIRVRSRSYFDTEPVGVDAGIAKMRSLLSTPRESVRLVGLSGVGKTRLAQALFDARVGENALSRDMAIYVDVADSPDPDPLHLANQLIASGEAAILVIDNCSRDLHRKLTQKICVEGSKLSLLTIEYDVREDVQEGTEVFRLEPTGDQLIEQLLEEHFPQLGHTNARSIARMSGGNFRVAIYIARTVKEGESLGVLRDEELFIRLFQQGHDRNDALLESAELLSLLYSFNGEDVSSGESELSLLAEIGERSVQSLYRDSNLIMERELIQQRAVWRAVLPHAVANSLAKRALRRLPKSLLVQKILSDGGERVIRSFFRRISYLHDSAEAQGIVDDLMKPDGWLGVNVHNLSTFGFNVLGNVAPVSPEAVLRALESLVESEHATEFFTKKSSHSQGYVKILFLIAYEDRYFVRAARLLSVFARTEHPEDNVNSIRKRLRTLYQIYLSGSHAKPQTRLAFLTELITSADESQWILGLELLESALKAGRFTGSHETDFGSHLRDYGSRPDTREEIERWFLPFMGIALQEALSARGIAGNAKNVLAKSFRGLWNAGFSEECERWVDAILGQSAWVDGWRAVKSILYYERDELSEGDQGRLRQLGEKLRPSSFSERFEFYIQNTHYSIFDPEDDSIEGEEPIKAYERAEQIAEEIGIEIGENETTLSDFCGKCVRGESSRFFELGKGLAQSRLDCSVVWSALKTALYGTPKDERNVGALRGFVWQLSVVDFDFYEIVLDEVIECSFLRRWMVTFHRSSRMNQRSIARLHRLLDEDLISAWYFTDLGSGRRHENISDDDLVDILEKILVKEKGTEVVLSILRMRFHASGKEPMILSTRMREFGVSFLRQLNFCGSDSNRDLKDHQIARVIDVVYTDGMNYENAADLLGRIAGNSSLYFGLSSINDSLVSLAKTEPMAVLDYFFADDERSKMLGRDHGSDHASKPNFMNVIDEEILYQWADVEPEVRYPRLAWQVQILHDGKGGPVVWSELALKLIDRSVDFQKLIDVFFERIYPSSFSGSYADLLSYRADLLEAIPCGNEDLDKLNRKVKELRQQSESRRVEELKRNRHEFQSFE